MKRMLLLALCAAMLAVPSVTQAAGGVWANYIALPQSSPLQGGAILKDDASGKNCMWIPSVQETPDSYNWTAPSTIVPTYQDTGGTN